MELRAGRFGLGVEGRYDVATVGVETGAQANVQRATGSLLPCARVGWVIGCGVVTFGETWARGNVASPATENAPYVALGVRGGARRAAPHEAAFARRRWKSSGWRPQTLLRIDNAQTGSGPVEASGGIALLVPIL